jgi:hypothetical protein
LNKDKKFNKKRIYITIFSNKVVKVENNQRLIKKNSKLNIFFYKIKNFIRNLYINKKLF